MFVFFLFLVADGLFEPLWNPLNPMSPHEVRKMMGGPRDRAQVNSTFTGPKEGEGESKS